MLFYIVFALVFIFTSLFLLPVNFVISYKNEIVIYFKFLFIKKKIPIDFTEKYESFSAVSEELFRIKNVTLDLYSKLHGKIKVSSAKIYATVNISHAFLYPMIFGTVSSLIGTFIGVLDSQIGVNKRKAEIRVNSAFLDTPATVFGEIVLKTSLYNVLFSSTYAIFRAIFKGGKNGRKQAK